VLASELEDPSGIDVNDIYIVDLENAAAYLVEENEPGVYGWMNYDKQAIGDNVYPVPEATDLDTQIAELRISFDRVQPSTGMITDFDFDPIVEEVKTYLESELDFHKYRYDSGTNEFITLDDVRDLLGVKNTYTIYLSNVDYCFNEERINGGVIHFVELESSEFAKNMTESFFSDLDYFRDRDLVIEEVPYGDWAGIMFAKSRTWVCQNFGDQLYTYKVDMMVENYYIYASFDFGDETSISDQKELMVSLVELLAYILEQNLTG
jgi:hypothetical protein